MCPIAAFAGRRSCYEITIATTLCRRLAPTCLKHFDGLQDLQTEGLLPREFSVPKATLQRPKQANLAASGIVFTSPFAFPLSAALARCGAARDTPENLARLLAMKLGPEIDGLRVESIKGHINLSCQEGMDKGATASCAADPKSCSPTSQPLEEDYQGNAGEALRPMHAAGS